MSLSAIRFSRSSRSISDILQVISQWFIFKARFRCTLSHFVLINTLSFPPQPSWKTFLDLFNFFSFFFFCKFQDSHPLRLFNAQFQAFWAFRHILVITNTVRKMLCLELSDKPRRENHYWTNQEIKLFLAVISGIGFRFRGHWGKYSGPEGAICHSLDTFTVLSRYSK